MGLFDSEYLCGPLIAYIIIIILCICSMFSLTLVGYFKQGVQFGSINLAASACISCCCFITILIFAVLCARDTYIWIIYIAIICGLCSWLCNSTGIAMYYNGNIPSSTSLGTSASTPSSSSSTASTSSSKRQKRSGSRGTTKAEQNPSTQTQLESQAASEIGLTASEIEEANEEIAFPEADTESELLIEMEI